jgi:ribose 5-phosphate isomerase A
MLTGVVEVGLFCDIAQAAYFGNEVSEHVSCLFISLTSDIKIWQDGSVTVKRKAGSKVVEESIPPV